MNKKIIKTLLLLSIIICITPFALEILFFRSNIHSILNKSEWSSFLGSYIGGAFGGIGTLLSVYFTTRETKKIQEENSIIIEREKESTSKKERKVFADNIVQDVAKYVTNISKYFYDCNISENLNKNIEKYNKELIDVKYKIRQNLEIEKELDFYNQKKEYIRIDREIEQLKQKEEELKYIIDENIRKLEKNKPDKTVAIECYFLLKMKLKDISFGKNVLNQLEFIHKNSFDNSNLEIKFIEKEIDILLNHTVSFIDSYVNNKIQI